MPVGTSSSQGKSLDWVRKGKGLELGLDGTGGTGLWDWDWERGTRRCETRLLATSFQATAGIYPPLLSSAQLRKQSPSRAWLAVLLAGWLASDALVTARFLCVSLIQKFLVYIPFLSLMTLFCLLFRPLFCFNLLYSTLTTLLLGQ